MAERRGDSVAQDPLRTGAQPGEAGVREMAEGMAEGMRQAQEFWTSMARSWSDAASAWMGQGQAANAGGTNAERMAAVRELQEAAFAVAQAWLRLPLLFVGAAQPSELQDAATRLTQAQSRAYQLWVEALSGAPGAAADSGDATRRNAGRARSSS